jgi:hypothetical protein
LTLFDKKYQFLQPIEQKHQSPSINRRPGANEGKEIKLENQAAVCSQSLLSSFFLFLLLFFLLHFFSSQFFFEGAVLGFELRVLFLLGRHSTTCTMPPALFCFDYFSGRPTWDHDPLTYVFHISGITSMHQHAQFID